MPDAATPVPRPRAQVAADLLIAGALLLLLGASQLLTPAFTDFEVESEPALALLLDAKWTEGLTALPVYGGAVLLQWPAALLADALGGGGVALFRAVAVPGAIGIALLAALAAHWLRAAGRRRVVQLGAVALLALSPALAAAWAIGHPEEVLVAALALAAVLLAARTHGPRGAAAAGALAGAAAAAQPSALLLAPVALAALPGLASAAAFAAAGAVAGIALLTPILLAQSTAFVSAAQGTGGGGIFTPGNAWWFLGEPNPAFDDAAEGGTQTLFTTANSARLGPEWVGAHAHELIVLLAVVLAAAWWWRRRTAGLPAGRGAAALASLLWLAAAVGWWRALLDPWFQAYYLVPALAALARADARAARVPATAAVAWVLLWLTHAPDAPGTTLDPDLRSALSLAWMVPLGAWITVRALHTGDGAGRAAGAREGAAHG